MMPIFSFPEKKIVSEFWSNTMAVLPIAPGFGWLWFSICIVKNWTNTWMEIMSGPLRLQTAKMGGFA